MRGLVVAGLALGLTACSGGTPVAQLPPPTATTTPTGSPTTGPVEPVTRLLDWQPVDAGPTDTLTTNGTVSITVDQAGRTVRISGVDATVEVPPGFHVSEVLLDETYAVVVTQDKQETQPSKASLITLANGVTRQIPTNANGGTWAMSDGSLEHAVHQGSKYCLESVDLDDLRASIDYCAPPRHGFSDANLTPYGATLLTFDARPSGSCRTPSQDGAPPVALPGVAACHGWDSLFTADGQVWSEVPKENQIEQAEFFASSGDQTVDLGVGTTGSLTWCGDSAYFVRDSQKDVDKARLLRWTPDHRLEVVYESPGEGNAFLSEPRCGGHVLTITAQGEGGDEQVSASVS